MLESLILKRKSVTTNENGEQIRNLADEIFVIPDEFQYEVVTVDETCVARPDLVSMTMYKSDVFTDILCKLNGISNPFELNVGMKLVCPTIDYMESFMNARDESDEIVAEPQRENVNVNRNKRMRPCDVTTSDSRYIIDKTRNIVIY